MDARGGDVVRLPAPRVTTRRALGLGLAGLALTTGAGQGATAALAAAGAPALRRGVNITNWFRYPASSDPAALARYLSDAALAGLRAAGFDFVRLAVDPDLVAVRPALLPALRRIQAAGLSVIVCPHPRDWRLEGDPRPLRLFWRGLAPRLRGLDPARLAVEVVNEPVFPGNPAGWAALQHIVLADLRAVLPAVTVVLTGADWGSIGGLLALTPEADPCVVYSVHFYDPSELTSLAAWLPGADRAAFARLPFPVSDAAACRAVGGNKASAGTVAAYCASGWDAARVRAAVARAGAWGRAHRVRVIAGEFGASTDLNRPARLAWLAAARQAFAAEGIGWALWGYDDSMGFAVPRPPPERPVLDPGVLAALGLAA